MIEQWLWGGFCFLAGMVIEYRWRLWSRLLRTYHGLAALRQGSLAREAERLAARHRDGYIHDDPPGR